MNNWIEPQHIAEATERVMETALFRPAEIADDSMKFCELTKNILQLYASGKTRQERGDMIVAALDEHFADLIREEAETVLDEQREDAFMRGCFARGY